MNDKLLFYDSQYIPPEWAAAHGFLPERLIPLSLGEAALSTRPPPEQALLGRMGCCEYAAAWVSEAAQKKGAIVVATTLCDQLRRSAELLSAATVHPFIFNMPRTWQNPAALKLYRAELERLSRFMQAHGGRTPDSNELGSIMLEYERGRKEKANAIAEELQSKRYRLALLGGPLTSAEAWVQELLSAAGGSLVLDASETGELALVPPYDLRRLCEDPANELASAYFTLPHPTRRPNDFFYAWLRERLVSRRVQGIIFWRHVWCDIWHVELARVREFCGLPVVDLDSSTQGGSRTRAESRILSLLELLP